MSTKIGSLSRGAQLLYQAGIPIVFCKLLLSSPRTAASMPFIASPTLWLLWKRSNLTDDIRPDLESLIWTYVLSGTAGVAAVATAQSIGGYALALLLFGSRTDEYLEGKRLSIRRVTYIEAALFIRSLANIDRAHIKI